MGLSNEAILKVISADRALASAMIFPHRHPQPSPPMHIKIMDLWASADEFVWIEAFREGGKTTLSEEFLTIEAAFQNFWYCLVIGETYTKACARIATIQREATQNMELLKLFGDLRGKPWNEYQAGFKSGVLIEALGWEQEMRNFKHFDRRPDRAYVDGIETRERVRSKEAVAETIDKLYLELVPAMDRFRRKIRWTDTPLASDCALVRLKNDPSWVGESFPICDRDIDDPAAKSLWPERYPMIWIREERNKYEKAGKLNAFLQERMLIGQGVLGKPFEDRHIKTVAAAPNPFMPRHLIMDPARTTNIDTSARTGYCVISHMGSRIYVYESGAHYWKPDEIIKNAFEVSARHNEAELNPEKNSLDEWLMQPMRNEMLRTGRSIPIKAVTAPRSQDKISFIMGLQPFFEAGDIVFVGDRSNHAEIISEILNFPSGKMDALNALAYTQKVFMGVPVYEDFSQANIIDGYTPPPQSALWLAFNSWGSDLACALVEIEGLRHVVLYDWISSIPPKDFVDDVIALSRAAYPRAKIQSSVPAELMDQVDRNALVSALRTSKLAPQKMTYALEARGILSPSIRTEFKNRRCFLVDTRAKNTLNAMAGNYRFPYRADGSTAPEPERTTYRLLVEAIESLTKALDSAQSIAAHPEGIHLALNPQGVEYYTALPDKQRRRSQWP